MNRKPTVRSIALVAVLLLAALALLALPVAAAPSTLPNVTVHVVDSTGADLQNVNVYYGSDAGGYSLFGTTAADGRVSQTIIAPGTTKTFYVSFAGNNTHVSPKQTVTINGDITIDFATVNAQVEVKTCTGATPIVGANVFFGSSAGGFSAFDSTDGGGIASGELFDGKQVEFYVEYNGTRSAKQLVSVIDGVVATFSTTKVELEHSQPVLYGITQYSGWNSFSSPEEMFPGSYAFKFGSYVVENFAVSGCAMHQAVNILKVTDHNGAPIQGATARGGFGTSSGSWHVPRTINTFGAVPSDANGVIVDLVNVTTPPTDMSYEMRVNGTTAVLTQNVGSNSVFLFQTQLLTVRLETCAGTPLDGGKPRWGSGSTYTTRWFPDNPGLATGSSAAGEVAGEAFPGVYSFEMQYKATADQRISFDFPADGTKVVFQTTAVSLAWPGQISYGGATGDSQLFTQPTTELLPGTYKFHFRDAPGFPGYTTDLTFSGCSFTPPTDLIVNVTADDDDGFCSPLTAGGDCTLREAINAANAMSSADTITFDIAASVSCATGTECLAAATAANDCTADNVCTITLGSVLPTVTDSAMTIIDGTGADITVSGNNSSGILVVGGAAGLTVRSLTLQDGVGGIGGAILNQFGALTVENSTFRGNSATLGGAIYSYPAGSLAISGSVFDGNDAVSGGALALETAGLQAAQGTTSTAVVYDETVTNSTFRDNVASQGGAIYSTHPIMITGSTFVENDATIGGALSTGDALRVENSTFSANTAVNGGAIQAQMGVIFNSTFAGNSGSDSGGAIQAGSAPVLAAPDTPATPSQIQLTNNVFAAGAQGSNCSASSVGIVDLGGNVSSDATCATTANSLANTDPLLEALADNGGPTETMALLAGSPALDFATAAVLPLDQRGITRPQGTGPDSGAFESALSSMLDDCPDVPGNLIENYCFEDGPGPWTFWTDAAGTYVTSSADPYQGQFAAHVALQKAGGNVQLYQKNLELKPNTEYQLSFAARSSNGRDLRAVVHQHDAPFTNYGLKWNVDITNGWAVYETKFTTTGFNAPVNDARLRFYFGPFDTDNMSYHIDWVVLREYDSGNPPPPIPPDPPVIVPPPGLCNPPVPGNLLANPGFENGQANWTFYSDGQAGLANATADPYECASNAQVNIVRQGGNVQLYQKDIALQGGETYVLRLAARSSGGQDVQLFMHKHGANYTNYGLNGIQLDLTPAWQVFVVEFTAVGSTPLNDARLRLWLAPFDQNGASFEFDDLLLLPKADFDALPTVTAAPDRQPVPTEFADKKKPPKSQGQGQPANSVLVQGYFLDGDESGRLRGGYVPDNGEPWCYAARPSMSSMYPANGRLSRVRIVGAGSPQSVTITRIFQNEPTGPTPDGYGVGTSYAQLRSERDDGGEGRVYSIAFTATYKGKKCVGSVVVGVPIDRATPATAGSYGYDSTAATP